MNKRTIRVAAAALISVAVLAVLAGLAVNAAQKPPAQEPQAFLEQGVNEDAQVQKLRNQLAQKGLSEEGRKSLEEKLALAERSAAQRTQGKAEQQGDKNPPPPAAAVIAQPDIPEEGIFEGSQGLVRPSQGDIVNVWQGVRGGISYQVFAGASIEQPSRGLLIVVTMDDDRPTGTRETYFAGVDVTRLRIVEVNETTVVLETDAGERLIFDLVTRAFSG